MTQLDATAGGVAGSFAYTPAAGTVLGVGSQTLSVTFTPSDTTDYNTANRLGHATGDEKLCAHQQHIFAETVCLR